MDTKHKVSYELIYYRKMIGFNKNLKTKMRVVCSAIGTNDRFSRKRNYKLELEK